MYNWLLSKSHKNFRTREFFMICSADSTSGIFFFFFFQHTIKHTITPSKKPIFLATYRPQCGHPIEQFVVTLNRIRLHGNCSIISIVNTENPFVPRMVRLHKHSHFRFENLTLQLSRRSHSYVNVLFKCSDIV